VGLPSRRRLDEESAGGQHPKGSARHVSWAFVHSSHANGSPVALADRGQLVQGQVPRTDNLDDTSADRRIEHRPHHGIGDVGHRHEIDRIVSPPETMGRADFPAERYNSSR